MTTPRAKFLVRFAAHVVGVSAVTPALLVAIHLGAQLDMELWPCELTLVPRHADVTSAPPGGRVRIEGSYQIDVEGCRAHFFPIMEWSNENGDVQMPLTQHHGSFRLRKDGPRVAARDHRIPFDALPGSTWTHRVTADWDKWNLPLGLSEVQVEYASVTVRVSATGPEKAP